MLLSNKTLYDISSLSIATNLVELTKIVNFFKEGTMAETFTRKEEMLVQESSEPSQSVTKNGDFMYNDRYETCVKGAPNASGYHFPTPVVQRED